MPTELDKLRRKLEELRSQPEEPTSPSQPPDLVKRATEPLPEREDR